MDQICRIWPLLKAHWKCSGFMFIDTASSRLTCEEAAHTARWLWACHWPTSTDAKKMQKEQTSRSQIEISSILYRMFNRSFDGKGLSQELHGLLWFHPGILMNSVHPLAATAPPALLVKPWYRTNMIGFWPQACSYIFVSGLYLYQLYQSNTPLYVNTKAILGHFLAVSWIWIAHGMLIPAQSVTFDLDCLLPFTLAIPYTLMPRLRNAKRRNAWGMFEATVSCYAIQGITLQCTGCLMML